MNSMIEPHDLMKLMHELPARRAADLNQLAHIIAGSLAGRRRLLDRLAGAMLEPRAVPAPTTVWHAHRNAQLRADFLEQVPAYSSAQLAALAGSQTRNVHALASRWRQEGKVFAVPAPSGELLFPAFQFGEDGRPLPPLADIVRAFPARSSPWELALWFWQPNSYLYHRRPLELLTTEPEAVVTAARRHFETPEAF